MKRIEDLITAMELEKEVIHFDNAALSCMPKPVIDSIHGYLLRRNSHGPEYDAYWKTTEEVRFLCAKKIKADPDELFFIQNTSMGINFVAKALQLGPGDNMIISDLEFPSNVYPWMNLERDGISVRIAKSKDGKIQSEAIQELMDERTKVVSVSWVVAANGSVTDIKEIGQMCRKNDVIYVVDGIQGLGQIPIDMKEIGCDFFVSGFFKWMMGPDGIGFVYIRKEMLEQLGYPWLGWAGMKHKFQYSDFKIDVFAGASRYETGNLNFSALCGLKACLEFTDGWEEEIRKKICMLTKYLREQLSKIEGIKILSDCTTISGITLFWTEDYEELAEVLRKQGFRFSVRGGLRLSLHFYNTMDEIDHLIQVIKKQWKERKAL